MESKNDYRLVIQTKQLIHNFQQIVTNTMYLQLTEPEKDFLSEIFSHSDAVQSFIWGEKKGEPK